MLRTVRDSLSPCTSSDFTRRLSLVSRSNESLLPMITAIILPSQWVIHWLIGSDDHASTREAIIAMDICGKGYVSALYVPPHHIDNDIYIGINKSSTFFTEAGRKSARCAFRRACSSRPKFNLSRQMSPSLSSPLDDQPPQRRLPFPFNKFGQVVNTYACVSSWSL